MIEIFAALIIGFGLCYLLMRGEVSRLRKENEHLLGSLFHRVGYKQYQSDKNIPTEIAPLIDGPPIREPDFPDLLRLQEDAREG